MHIAQLGVADALSSLRSGESGLSAVEAQRRAHEYGANKIDEVKGEPPRRQFLKQFTHFLALILWVAAGLAVFAESRSPSEGMWQLGVAIVTVILINGVFSFWQEYRAEQAISALSQLLPQSVRVMRDGQLVILPAASLVPGDVVILEEGDNVPADCRLISGNDVRVNTSTITGESQPRARNADPVDSPIALDTINLLLAGTSLISGRGQAVVYATGMHTEFGKIAHLTQTVEKTASHLQQEIARLSKWVAIFATTLGIVFFAIGTWMGLPFWANLMFAIGIIVANVPEGLLPTVTLSLAMGTQRMAKRNALIRHLPAVETLGATTVICSDKTGTLTQNRMRVQQLFFDGAMLDGTDLKAPPSADHLLRNAQACHNLRRSQTDGAETWLGDPMEVALSEFARHAKDFGPSPILGQLSFDGDRRRMSVTVEHGGKRWLYCKGAPEVVLRLCASQERGGDTILLDEQDRRAVLKVQETMADGGLRVIAFAFRNLDSTEPPVEQAMTFSGLLGLHDPPRPEVAEAMGRCHSAGIKVIMVTGDHPHTAVAIGREIGLIREDKPCVILGDALQKMTTAQLQIALDNPEILFARMTAEQKMRVVNGLTAKGEIVAVTGDGVNDAPALKSAHIGIAMGIAGTDVAKAAADMILLDDNFASIVNAIEEGRAVFENIRKFLTYILTSNIPELMPYLAFVLFKIPLPLTIIQILAVDLGTDMLPALALGAERPDAGLMQVPPRPAQERLLSWPLVARAYLWLGMLEAVVALTVFFFVLQRAGWQYGDVLEKFDPLYMQATTACLAAIVVAQMVNVFLCRHPLKSGWNAAITKNHLLLIGLMAELGLILLITYSPSGNELFATRAFEPLGWGVIVVLALGFGVLEETRKYFVRRGHQSAETRRK